ncbi:MAG: Ku protein [Phycisphaerales bacterium]
MPRSLWSGSISFGLVNIPIKLSVAVREKRVSLHMMSPDGKCRLRRKLYCPDTGKEYDFKETARAYEIAPDQYVLIDEEEREAILPEKGRTVEIREFVDLSSIDPIYFNSGYFVIPDQSGAKAYRLLADAMTEMNRAAIAQFVMRQKEYLVTIRPKGRGIMMHTMHYADEVETIDDIKDIPEDIEIPKKELEVAKKLVEALEADFEPEKYHDTYREKLEALIEAKQEGEEIVTVESDVDADEPRVINIMDALKQSVAEAKKSGGSSSGRKKRRKTG